MANSLINSKSQLKWNTSSSYENKLLEVDHLTTVVGDNNLIVTKEYLDGIIGDSASAMKYIKTVAPVTTGSSVDYPTEYKKGYTYYVTGLVGESSTYIGTVSNKLPCTDGDLVIAKEDGTAWLAANFDVVAGSSRDNVVIKNPSTSATGTRSVVTCDSQGLVISYESSDSLYTPKSHVGAVGEGVHGLGNGTNAGFSDNNFTSEEKTKLAGLTAHPTGYHVPNGGTTGQVLAKSSNVDGTFSWINIPNGTVTNVSGTGPISVTNGTTTPAISISAATTSSAGTMSADDKAKLDGLTAHPTGYHVPNGGTTGQVLAKSSNVDGAFEWKASSFIVPATVTKTTSTFYSSDINGALSTYPLLVFLNGQLLQSSVGVGTDDVTYSSNTYTISSELWLDGSVVRIIFFKNI